MLASHVQFNKEINKRLTHKTNKLVIKKKKNTPKKAQHRYNLSPMIMPVVTWKVTRPAPPYYTRGTAQTFLTHSHSFISFYFVYSI